MGISVSLTLTRPRVMIANVIWTSGLGRKLQMLWNSAASNFGIFADVIWEFGIQVSSSNQCLRYTLTDLLAAKESS